MELQKKFAIVNFAGHKKKITYLSQNGKSDVKAMREAILLSEDDAISKNVKNCIDIIFEIFDTDVGTKVELNSNAILNTVSELDITFVYEVSQLLENVTTGAQFENLSKILPGISNSESNLSITQLQNNTPYSSKNKSAVTYTIPMSFVLILYFIV